MVSNLYPVPPMKTLLFAYLSSLYPLKPLFTGPIPLLSNLWQCIVHFGWVFSLLKLLLAKYSLLDKPIANFLTCSALKRVTYFTKAETPVWAVFLEIPRTALTKSLKFCEILTFQNSKLNVMVVILIFVVNGTFMHAAPGSGTQFFL